MCLLIQYDYAKLSADSVDEEKKSLMKAGNDSFWKYWCPLKIFGDFRDFYFLGQPIYRTHK